MHYVCIIPYTATLNNSNFHPLEVVSRYRDALLQVDVNYSYLPNLDANLGWLNTHFVPNLLQLTLLTKQIKNDYSRA